MRLGRLTKKTTAFFLCDVQEKFVPLISNMDSVVFVSNYLSSASAIFNCPLIVTEQYPKGLGNTYSGVTLPAHAQVFAKTKFSMLTEEVDEALKTHKEAQGIEDVVLFGIEAHVCIQQTAIDLLEKGYNVHIAADGTSSQRRSDRMMAFERMRQMGVYISTSESILFQLAQDAKDEHFKQISALSKGERPETGLCASAL